MYAHRPYAMEDRVLREHDLAAERAEIWRVVWVKLEARGRL